VAPNTWEVQRLHQEPQNKWVLLYSAILCSAYYRNNVSHGANGLLLNCRYQSLHTVVLTDETLPLEIQIRTKDMHLQAEFGIAAHWRYKTGNCFWSVPEMVEWDRWVVTWQREMLHKDHPSSLGSGTLASDMHTNPSHSDVCSPIQNDEITRDKFW
jgi:hypothetical protein